MIQELKEFFENKDGQVEINEEEIEANVELLFAEMEPTTKELAERTMEDFALIV